MVKSKEIYSTQSYCTEYLGFCPIMKCEEDELRKILDNEGYEDLWDYPLTEIDHIVENDLDVVLVDCTYIDGSCQIVNEYRWFQIP